MNQQLEKWETWPLWALGLSNGVNIALWYTLSMIGLDAPDLNMELPAFVNDLLPFVIIGGGVAAALSLDGVLIATLAGVRGGRRGWWSWTTIAGAGIFSAAIAYAIHSGDFREWAWLHMAQAGVLVLYNFHLSQPRKALQADENSVGSGSYQSKPDSIGVCKSCGESHATLTEYSACARRKRQLTDIPDPVSHAVSVVRQGETPRSTNGVNP